MNEKLLSIQQKLVAPKNQYNSFGKYNYRSLEDIMVAVKPLLAENKCTLTFHDTLIAEGVLECMVVLTDSESDQRVSATSIVGVDSNRKGMDIAQSYGASSSYGRKYAANGLFLIDDTKDADSTNKHDSGVKKPITLKTPPSLKKMTTKQYDSFLSGIASGKFDLVEKFLSEYEDDDNKAVVLKKLTEAKKGKA